MCFREAARIAKIAKETECVIYFETKNGKGSSESILSLVKLEMKPEYTVVVTAKGKFPELAYSKCIKLFAE